MRDYKEKKMYIIGHWWIFMYERKKNIASERIFLLDIKYYARKIRKWRTSRKELIQPQWRNHKDDLNHQIDSSFSIVHGMWLLLLRI